MKKNYLLLLLLCVLGLASCESVEDQGTKTPLGDAGNDLQYINGKLYAVIDGSDKIVVGTPPGSGERIFILNQGAFQKKNCRLDLWDGVSDEVKTDQFTSASDHTTIAFPLGTAPAKIAQISSTEALVPGLYSNQIAVIDLASNTIKSNISLSDTGQYSIALLGGKAYSVGTSGAIIKIDIGSKTVESRQWLNPNAAQVVADSVNNLLLVLTNGNYVDLPAKLYWVNPTTLSAVDSMTVQSPDFINMIVRAGTIAYVLYSDRVMKLDLSTHVLTSLPMFSQGYYSGYYDASKNYLYLGTAIDYQHDDKVDVFDLSTNTLKKTLNVGILPIGYVVVK